MNFFCVRGFMFYGRPIKMVLDFKVKFLGIFRIKAPLFGHKTQRFYFCYLQNIKFKWKQFKWKILDNSNYDNLHGGGDFSHAYVIMNKYFCKKLNMQKMNTKACIYNLTCFLLWNFFIHFANTWGHKF